jgi:hypothetical protein
MLRVLLTIIMHKVLLQGKKLKYPNTNHTLLRNCGGGEIQVTYNREQ